MKVLLKSAVIVDSRSPLHGKKRDILIENGKITSIATSITEPKAKEIAAKGLSVSPGWTDLRANFCDPGFEFKEDLNSGIQAAKRGGFTSVVIMPSTLPVIDNKSGVEYVLSKAKGKDVRILVAGSLSNKMEGKQMSEMYDMHQSGAVAFTDDKKNVGTELMMRALDYTRNFGGLVMSFPYDKGVSAHGQMHEGITSVSMGTPGIPGIAEEIRLQRDIELLRYSGGRLHVSLISTAKSVDMIRKAKKEGLNITCAIAAHQLYFLDEDMLGFDTNKKVMPPFRSKDDRKALIAGLKDGTIDAICSDHTPQDVEHKVREFEDASFGISSIETAFCTAFTALEKHMALEEIVSKFTSGPATVLGMEAATIKEGNVADITVFTTEDNTTFDSSSWKSKSKNSTFIGMELRGKVVMTH
jgi:dihydroorotase